LPFAERGPVLFFALRRFAAICRSEAIWLFRSFPKFAENDFVGGFFALMKPFRPAPFKLSVKDDTLHLSAGFPSFEAINNFLTVYVGPSEFHVGNRHSSASAGVIM
jgi:hypothetical protein